VNVRANDPSDYIRYSPIIDRPTIVWPGGARVALWFALNVEVYEFLPPRDRYSSIYRPDIFLPDVPTYGMLDYGNRVGFWRTLSMWDRRNLPMSVSLNLAMFKHFPEITDEILARNWDIFSHGLYNTRFLYGMREQDERRWINENVSTMLEHTGKPLRGMFGPCISLTENSMDLWVEAGLTYVVDWFMDDQPFPVTAGTGLVDVPYSFDINDGLVMGDMPGRGGRWEADEFLYMCKSQFDTLYREGAQSGRVMCVALHPFVIGHPARIGALERFLEYVQSHDDVWYTTATEIATYYREHYYEQALAWQLGAP
jgi:allantoinase